MEIRRVTEAVDVQAAGHLFDSRPNVDATRQFLADPGHHLLIAYEGTTPAGFVSGVETTHPDKGTEMFLYELDVDDLFQRRGVATQLIDALADLARRRGCYGMWVDTDHDNAAALATYAKAGGAIKSSGVVTFTWEFGPG